MRLKKIDYKQFEFFDKTDKKLKLDWEKKNFLGRLKIALVNNSLGQNTQDLRKSFDEIEPQKDELSKDERYSTNNKSENDRLNMILSVIDRTYQFYEHRFLSGEESDELKLPKMGKSKQKMIRCDKK